MKVKHPEYIFLRIKSLIILPLKLLLLVWISENTAVSQTYENNFAEKNWLYLIFKGQYVISQYEFLKVFC